MFKMSHTAKENTQATETRIFYISSVLAAYVSKSMVLYIIFNCLVLFPFF